MKPLLGSSFSPASVKVQLEWRGMEHAFWNFQVRNRGPFRPATELDIEQARAVAAAVVELDARLAGLAFDGDELPRGQQMEIGKIIANLVPVRRSKKGAL